MSQKFSCLVVQKIIEAPFIDNAIKNLDYLKTKNIHTYIVSATPDEEIKYIMNKKNIGRYFLEIHGSPRKKADITRDILQRKRYIPEN